MGGWAEIPDALASNGAAHSEQNLQSEGLQLQYVAEAALGESYLELEEGREPAQGSAEEKPDAPRRRFE